MKNIFYLFIAGLLFIIACKKETTNVSPVIAPQQYAINSFYLSASFTFLYTAGGNSGAVSDTPYYYLPAVIKLNITEQLATSYEWYLKRQGMADSLFSTVKNPVLNYYTTLSKAAIMLVAKNGLSSTTITKYFKIKSTPNSLTITKMIIDTMSFIDPATSLPWNGGGGANVFCRIFKGASSSILMDTLNGAGWAAAPSPIANTYPVKKNLSAAPYQIARPTGSINFKISSAIPGVTMLDSFKIKIFNKNSLGTADLIGEADLTPSDYFGGVLPTTLWIRNPASNLYLKLSVAWL